MGIAQFQAFSCPLDGLMLEREGNSLKCATGHCFDFDRKGIVNLLPVQFKKSLEPGDSKEMVAARRAVLDSGLYQPVSDFLNGLIDIKGKTALSVLDAGCGEGYYTARLAEYMLAQNPELSLSIAGLDISKEAVHAASARNRSIQWIVGTNAHLPIADHSLDVVLCMFGFPVWEEFRRVLKPDGIVICADPGEEHLIEVRKILYPEIKEKNNAKTIAKGFVQSGVERLHQEVMPPVPEILDAQIMMTPHGYRVSAEQRHKAVHTLYKGMTLDVVFSIYRMQSSVEG